jgi:deoxyribose-phosphate aldolase
MTVTSHNVRLDLLTARELDLIDRALQLAYGQLEASRDMLRVYRDAADSTHLKIVLEHEHAEMGELLLKIQAAR